MADEDVQELGREGVGQVRAWLESTTWIELPCNAYEDGPRCKLVHHAGVKKFDLRGHFHGPKDKRRDVTIEAKRYKSPGAQGKEFKSFLAIAYSYTHKKTLELGEPWSEEFIWVTSHPFSQKKWVDLDSEKYLLDVLSDAEYGEYLGGHDVDPQLAREVAARVWVLVLNKKQLNVTLTQDELAKVMTVLGRKENTLWNG